MKVTDIPPDPNKKMILVFGGSRDNKIDFHGDLDEIAFFNRVLSSKEIKNLYNSANINTR